MHPIKIRRKRLILNTEELAHKLGMKSGSTIKSIEAGWVNPTEEKIEIFSKVFKISTRTLKSEIRHWEKAEILRKSQLKKAQ